MLQKNTQFLFYFWSFKHIFESSCWCKPQSVWKLSLLDWRRGPQIMWLTHPPPGRRRGSKSACKIKIIRETLQSEKSAQVETSSFGIKLWILRKVWGEFWKLRPSRDRILWHQQVYNLSITLHDGPSNLSKYNNSHIIQPISVPTITPRRSSRVKVHPLKYKWESIATF